MNLGQAIALKFLWIGFCVEQINTSGKKKIKLNLLIVEVIQEYTWLILPVHKQNKEETTSPWLSWNNCTYYKGARGASPVKPLVSSQHKVGAESRGQGYAYSNDNTSFSTSANLPMSTDWIAPMYMTYTHKHWHQG